MKRIAVVAGLAAFASLGLAQSIDTPTNIALRVGYAYPLDNQTRDLVKGFLGAGVDIFLTKSLLPGERTETAISLDWLGKSSSGSKGNVFPLLVTQRWYTDSAANAIGLGRYYYLGGVGVAVVDVTSTKTVLALKAGLGFEINNNIFAEASFLYTEKANNARGTNLGFHLGYRF